MNSRDHSDHTPSIEHALTDRWASRSPDPCFVARLERTLIANVAPSCGTTQARQSLGRSLGLSVAGWVAIGVAVVVVLAGAWLGTQSNPPVLDTLTATPSMTTSAVPHSPEAIVPQMYAMLSDGEPSPTRMPVRPQPVHLSPDPTPTGSVTPESLVVPPTSADTTNPSH